MSHNLLPEALIVFILKYISNENYGLHQNIISKKILIMKFHEKLRKLSSMFDNFELWRSHNFKFEINPTAWVLINNIKILPVMNISSAE